MGESACLLRSFSDPCNGFSEAREGDPVRALGDSVSFGRFYSEPLDWEKWSTFSRNRHLEEAEKLAKPGLVAQKKAYFEAHYKKIAAMKAAASLEEANAAAGNVPQEENIDELNGNASMDIDLEKANDHAPFDEQQKRDAAPVSTPPHSTDAIPSSFNAEGDRLETSRLEGSEIVKEQHMYVESSTQVEIPNQLENVAGHDKVAPAEEEKVPIKEAADQEILASANKKRLGNPSPKSSMCSRASKIPSPPAKRTTSIQPTLGHNGAANSKKAVGHPIDRKRLAPSSLHMSINFASSIGEISNTSNPAHQQIRSTRTIATSRKIPSDTSRISTRASVCGTPKDRSKTSRTLIRASVCGTSRDSSNPSRTLNRASVCGISKDSSNTSRTLNMATLGIASNQPSVTTKSEDRRPKTQLNKSVSGAITAVGKWHSLSVDHSESSTVGGKKSRSTIISSPFSFRSEERAAKRKEFFQKMEEKISAREAEKGQLQTGYKGKTEHDLKKLRQSTSTGLKANPKDDPHVLPLPNNHLKKISSTQPRSPKLGRKPTPAVQGTISRTPGKPPVSTYSSKRGLEKGHKTTRSVTSLPKKNTSENASPNIQH